MFVGTIFDYVDESAITTLPISDVRVKPLYLALFTSDKGTEELTEFEGKDWFNMYGNNISFAKHGQPLLQTAISINAGARVLSKRLVASDATLANLSIVANLDKVETQKLDEGGNPLYLDVNGNQTTEVTDTPIMDKIAIIRYEGKAVSNINDNDIDRIHATVEAELKPNQYLLFTITDNGRGKSNKRFMITPNYRLSKAKSYIEYTLTVVENNVALEAMTFNLVPDLVVYGKNHSIEGVVETSSSQIHCKQNESGINSFLNALSELTSMEDSELKSLDYIFGYNRKGVKLNNIVIDDVEGLNLQNSFGHALLEGSNGSFGDCPIDPSNEAEYVKQVKYTLGTDSNNVFDTAIYDLDRYKIDICIDANYPDEVKRAIETLVTFREDFVFLRDLGLNCKNLEAIRIANEELVIKNKFIATYAISYEIIDPYSKRQIPVTVGYDMAKLMVNHINAGRVLPVAGIKHDMIISSAIKGTLNFSPTICPEPLGNQKEVMEEIKVNYAKYIGEDLVIETEYTSQEDLTQFSFLNNVMATQEVVRAIRNRCPIIRYSFIDGQDLERYKADIEDVIANYSSNFKSIVFKYVRDPVYVNNKIFYAAIDVGFRDFIQTEWFKITAINVSESDTTTVAV